MSIQQRPGETRSGLGLWLPQMGVLSRGLSLNCSPQLLPRLGSRSRSLKKHVWGLGWVWDQGLFIHTQGLACRPPSSQDERRRGRGRGLHMTCSWEGNPTGVRMESLEERKWSGRGFAKAELTYLLPRAMHTTTSVCLSVQSPVCAIPNASALPLAACSCSSCLIKPLRH